MNGSAAMPTPAAIESALPISGLWMQASDTTLTANARTSPKALPDSFPTIKTPRF